uniref:Uncharacterized protein n=1 Tax=Arundo donax TaxID=35708 RepID=A0A0A9B3R3_ARUDO
MPCSSGYEYGTIIPRSIVSLQNRSHESRHTVHHALQCSAKSWRVLVVLLC